MTQENFDNPELKDVFDDLISQDKFDILSCDEPYAPPNLSFKEICTYPFIGKNIFFTISIFGLNFALTNYGEGLFLAIFLNILYGIYLIRKILNIKDTFETNSKLMLFFVYSFFINCVGWMVTTVTLYCLAEYILPKSLFSAISLENEEGYVFLNILSPVISYLNILLCSGFIITFSIGECRPIYSYLKYKKELAKYNIYTLCLLLAVFFAGLFLISFNFHSPLLKTVAISLMSLGSSYIILTSLISWTSFLRKDLYPEVFEEMKDAE